MSDFDKAMRAAKHGPEIKGLRIRGHGWNVKPYSQIGPKPSPIVGQISHRLGLGRPDDQVFYTIGFNEKGGVKKIKIRIKDGGYTDLLAPILAAIGTYVTETPIPPSAISAVGKRIGQAIDGTKWRQVAHYLVAHIALRA